MYRTVLKWGALFIMTIDHIAYAQLGSFITPTRGAFVVPAFAFLLVLGYRNTRNIDKYLLRLLVFGLIAQVPYCLFFGYSPCYRLNMVLVFFLALALIRYVDRWRWLTLVPLLFLFSPLRWLGVSLLIPLVIYKLVSLPWSRWLEQVSAGRRPGLFQRYFFYLFYPGHLAVLYAVSRFI